MSQTPPPLFTPLKVGPLSLEHRVVMPALSLRHAEPPHGIPSGPMVLHYEQRATRGGLLVAETSWVRATAGADGREPGLHTPEQVNAWRAVTRAVHARGGFILAQLGEPPATAGSDPPAQPLFDVRTALRQVRDAAESAGDAGFDGVEYLATVPERQFHQHGELADRLRLLVETVQTLDGVSPGRCVGLRLSIVTKDTRDRHPDAHATLRAAVTSSFEAGAAYVHVGPAWPDHGSEGARDLSDTLSVLRPTGSAADGILIASGGIDARSAASLLQAGLADAVAFGRPFLGNPDLPARLRSDAPWAPWPGVEAPESERLVGQIRAQ